MEIIQSSEITELVKALLEFQKTAEDPVRLHTAKVRTRNEGYYMFSYASLEDMLPAVRMALGNLGVHVSQFPCGTTLVTQLTHTSGQWFRCFYDLGVKPDATAQDRGSALTYARRYSIMAMLALVAEDDDDGNLASGNDAEITISKIVSPSEKFLAKATKALGKLKTEDEIDAALQRQSENIMALPQEAKTKFDEAVSRRRKEISQ